MDQTYPSPSNEEEEKKSRGGRGSPFRLLFPQVWLVGGSTSGETMVDFTSLGKVISWGTTFLFGVGW